MKKFTLAFLLVLAYQWVSGQRDLSMSQFYPVDEGHSYIEFSVKYMGYAKVKGRFTQFPGLFRYDEKDLSKTSITLVIKTESIDTDLEFRDNDLKSENWFDAKKFPTMIFKSKKATPSAQGFDVTGDLTLKGVTKEIILHMDPASGVLKDVRGDAQVIFTGTTSLDRTEFGVEGKNWSAVKEGVAGVGSEVKIEFSVLGKQLKAPNFSNWVKDEQQPAGKLYKIAKTQGTPICLAEFQKMKAGTTTVDESALNSAGRMLLLEGKTDDAIALLETNRKSFPESSNAAYSLGAAYGTKGDWAKAKENLEGALRLDPANARALEVLRHIPQ
jgi:polyisoprenoid-binding protein YceI